jgi:hypothetical protein
VGNGRPDVASMAKRSAATKERKTTQLKLSACRFNGFNREIRKGLTPKIKETVPLIHMMTSWLLLDYEMDAKGIQKESKFDED